MIRIDKTYNNKINMSKVLVIFEDPEEYDFYGHCIYDKEEWDLISKLLNKYEYSIALGYSNDEIIDYNDGKDFLINFEVKEISEDLSKEFFKLFEDDLFGYDFHTDIEIIIQQMCYNEDFKEKYREDIEKLLNIWGFEEDWIDE